MVRFAKKTITVISDQAIDEIAQWAGDDAEIGEIPPKAMKVSANSERCI